MFFYHCMQFVRIVYLICYSIPYLFKFYFNFIITFESLTYTVRENSVCIIHVIFNAATDGDKPVKRRVKYDNVREHRYNSSQTILLSFDSLCPKDILKGILVNRI